MNTKSRTYNSPHVLLLRGFVGWLVVLTLTLLEPQSCSGDKPLKFQVVLSPNETAVLKGLTHRHNRHSFVWKFSLVVVVITLTHRHNTMQPVVAGPSPITLEWKKYLGKKVKQEKTHDNWSTSTSPTIYINMKKGGLRAYVTDACGTLHKSPQKPRKTTCYPEKNRQNENNMSTLKIEIRNLNKSHIHEGRERKKGSSQARKH